MSVSSEPVADTPFGRVRGVQENGVCSFKGIRYAASTGGANRFMPPQPAAPWTGVADAQRFGPMAPQSNPSPSGAPPQVIMAQVLAAAGLARPKPPPESEDCLFLNVWTPGLDRNQKRPVMVWLHGGFFAGGSGASIDGAALARRGDVVVVSLNHRLNVFGFTYLAEHGGSEFEHAGNAGMLDVLAALRWIHDGIDRFGGDAGRVMVFGQSGGGMKTAFLLACPAARGLIHRAGIQSGPGLAMLERFEAADVTARLLGKLQLRHGAIDELRSLPVQQLLRGYFQVAAELPGLNFSRPAGFGPVLDDEFLPAHPFSDATLARSGDIPLLIGWNRHEMTFFMGDDAAGFALDESQLQARLQALIGDGCASVLRIYRETHPSASPTDLFIQIWSDTAIMEPTLRLAERQVTAGRAAAYLYRFDWPSPALDGKLKSTHTLEANFVFDALQAPLLAGAGRDKAALACVMSAAWARFAASGDPNGNDFAEPWPAYELQRRPTMLWNTRSRVAADPSGPERRALGSVQPAIARP